MGVDVIGGLQPPPLGDCDFAELKRKYGDKACLIGGLDPVYTFELGTPQRLHQAVKELFDQAQGNRGIITGTSKARPRNVNRKLVRADTGRPTVRH